MRDSRRAPFCWQSCEAMALIRERFTGKRLTTAVALYQAFTEIANEERADAFIKPREVIAAKAGTSVRTVSEYAPDFEAIDLLRRTRRTGEGGAELAPEWELIGPPAGAATPPAANDAETPHPPAAASHLDQEVPTTTKEPTTPQERRAPDVARLADLLEAKVNEVTETPGRKRVTEAWLTSIDRLLRIDGRTPEQVGYVIDWLGGPSEGAQFWAANVQSGRKLREKFDQLVARIKAERGGGRRRGVSGSDLRQRAEAARRAGH